MADAEVGRTMNDEPPMGEGAIEGRLRVERLGGMLPPMVGVSKEIRGGRGTVRLGPLRGPSFRVRNHGEGATQHDAN